MEIFDYPLIFYWDGQLLEENGEVSYVGGRQCVVFGDTSMTHGLLVEWRRYVMVWGLKY